MSTALDSTTTVGKADLIGTAILGAVGLVALVMGLGYGFTGDAGGIGPGFLPVLVGAFILVAASAELIRMVLGLRSRATSPAGAVAPAGVTAADPSEDAPGRDTFGRTAHQRSRAVVLIFASIVLALLLIPVIGLLLSLTAMMLGILIGVERKPVVTSLLVSGATFGVAYLIFVLALDVPVPTGMLGLI